MTEDDFPDPWPALAERLPGLVRAQFEAYRRLMTFETDDGDGPREVTAWENARKAALAHLQALIRVHDLVQARLGREAAGGTSDLERMLADVRRELAETEAGEGEAEA